jgi:hypothetical protein
MYVPRGLNPSGRLQWTGWITTTDTGCWEWSGLRNDKGYGRLWYAGRGWNAHRLAYQAWVKPVSDDVVIRHTCDNPPCINPKHLIAGTQQDNVQDREDRGRRQPPKGALNGRASLTEVEAFDIKFRLSQGERVTDIARSFGMSVSKISHIKNGVTWVD